MAGDPWRMVAGQITGSGEPRLNPRMIRTGFEERSAERLGASRPWAVGRPGSAIGLETPANYPRGAIDQSVSQSVSAVEQHPWKLRISFPKYQSSSTPQVSRKWMFGTLQNYLGGHKHFPLRLTKYTVLFFKKSRKPKCQNRQWTLSRGAYCWPSGLRAYFFLT